MESSEQGSSNLLSLKSPKLEKIMDWRPEAIRIVCILLIVIGHMVTYTGYITNDLGDPLIWIAGSAVGIFMICASYVQSLKDEFNKPGSLNPRSYWKFFKNRFLRLYIGYWLALIVVFVTKLTAGFTFVYASSGLTIGGSAKAIPVIISPESLVLDLTCMWPMVTGVLGGIFPEAWFICAIMILSLVYPFLRRLYSINPKYLYLIIVITLLFRILIAFFSNPNYAFHFPFAWTAEFSVGIILGARLFNKGGPAPPSALYKQIFIRIASRVWPIYLLHMAAIVYMPTGQTASVQDFILTVVFIIILVEFFVRILTDINNLIGLKKKKILPPG